MPPPIAPTNPDSPNHEAEKVGDYSPKRTFLALRSIPVGTSCLPCLDKANLFPVLGLYQISWFAPCLRT